MEIRCINVYASRNAFNIYIKFVKIKSLKLESDVQILVQISNMVPP